MLRKITVPSTTLFMAVAVKSADNSTPEHKPILCKPSNLPIYAPLIPDSKKSCHVAKKSSPPVQAIEDGVKVVRQEICNVIKSAESQKAQLNHHYEDAKKQTQFVRDYLNEPDNTIPRAGAIAVGGLAGLIFGVRGGFFRKLIYTSIGAGGVASICYPKEAEVYAQKSLVEGKKYATIGYNFVYGIKPGDKDQKHLPKIPTSFDEIKDSVTGLAKSAYDSVFPDKKK